MVELSVILPCQNEEKAIVSCIRSIKYVLSTHNIDGEIIVSDSSTDNSAKLAKKEKVIVIEHGLNGYGNAYLQAFSHVKGQYIIMGDADGSYDFSYIPLILKKLQSGNDFFIGNRFNKNMKKHSMPFLHKYIGNPFLTCVFNVLFKSNIRDVHCGIRGIKTSSLQKLDLRASGMEFASELVLQVITNNMKIIQLNVPYFERIGVSKLRMFSDGFRHLYFMFSRWGKRK